ncbi:MAG TPA: hypothetical protein VGR86_00650 [Steroidobacteraceae bacterium]|nr:hypothetical protein [Steroidobacteraceae bacterium]
MWLIEELERRLAAESSLLRAQLLREDIARLRKLDALARSAPDAEAYRKTARRLGWTAQDARTGELSEALDLLLESWRRALGEGPSDELDARMLQAWQEMTRLRLENMVGCLSTRLPKPPE